MTTVNIYLTFMGNCAEAFEFYKSVFQTEFQFIGRFKDIPSQPNGESIPKDQENLVMHVSLPISKETILFGSDTSDYFTNDFTPGNNFSISVHVDSKAEADRLFSELSYNGQQLMPMQNTFWGSYFGQLKDQFGISWMVNYALDEN